MAGRRAFLWAVAGLVLVVAGTAREALLWPDGDRLTGRHLRTEGGRVYFESDKAGLLVVEENAVRLVTEPAALPVASAPVEPSGPASSAPGAPDVGETKPSVLPRLIKRRVEGWEGRLSAGLELDQGATQRERVSVDFKANYNTRRHEVNLHTLYQRSDSQVEDDPSKDRFEADVAWKYNLSPTWLTRTEYDYQLDRIPFRLEQYSLSGGVGYRWTGPEERWSSITTAGLAQTVTLSDSPTPGTRDEELQPVVIEELRIRLPNRLTFESEATFFVEEFDPSRLSFDWKNDLSLQLTAVYDLVLRYRQQYRRLNERGDTYDDRRLTLMLGIKF